MISCRSCPPPTVSTRTTTSIYRNQGNSGQSESGQIRIGIGTVRGNQNQGNRNWGQMESSSSGKSEWGQSEFGAFGIAAVGIGAFGAIGMRAIWDNRKRSNLGLFRRLMSLLFNRAAELVSPSGLLLTIFLYGWGCFILLTIHLSISLRNLLAHENTEGIVFVSCSVCRCT